MSGNFVIGLVEDDPVQAQVISAMVETAGMQCLVFNSEQDFRRRLGPESVDLLLLDWNLPKISGLQLLKDLRTSATMLPVIFITANHREEDIVAGLSAGADDYIIKPPRSAELMARIKAAIRRVTPNSSESQISGVEPFFFDLSQRQMTLDGKPEELTDREFDLMVYLFQRAGKVVSRETLLTQVWRLGPNVATRSVDTYVSRLRKRFALQGDCGWRLDGIYQHGYRLTKVDDVSSES